MTAEEETPEAGLFDVVELREQQKAGRAEAALHRALAAAAEDGRLQPVDAALAAAALVAARALDNADRVGGLKGGYLVAQSLTGYRETLHALRLPAATLAVPVPLPAEGHTDLSGLLGDLGNAFGTPQ